MLPAMPRKSRHVLERHCDTCSAASNLSLAFWNSSSGFCTQMADSSTKCLAPPARAASSAFSVAW